MTSLEHRQLFAMTTKYWRPADPYVTAEEDGYNAGNALLGLDASLSCEVVENKCFNRLLVSDFF